MREITYRYLIYIFCVLLLACDDANTTNRAFTYPTAKTSCAQSPWCNFKGVENKWPEGDEQKETVPVTNLTFKVNLPNNYNRLSVIAGMKQPILTAHYDSYRISIALEEIPDIMKTEGAEKIIAAHKVSQYKPIDFYHILFSSTPKTPEPENLYDRRLWRAAFIEKAQQYKFASDAEIYKKEQWRGYMAKVSGVSYSRSTVVTHQSISDRYLRVYDTGAPKSVIEAILASVTLDQ